MPRPQGSRGLDTIPMINEWQGSSYKNRSGSAAGFKNYHPQPPPKTGGGYAEGYSVLSFTYIEKELKQGYPVTKPPPVLGANLVGVL